MKPQRGALLWDLPTRLFHWTLVALIALLYASGEFGWLSMEWHYRFGYATLALIVFRMLWGIAGSQTSRFANFVRGPGAVWRYLAASWRGRAAHAVGHNPLGGWSVLALLASVALQAVSGLFSSDDISEEGPLVARASAATIEWMTRIHHLNRYVLLALIGLHVAAVLLHWVIRNDNLIAPMLHGRAVEGAPGATRIVSSWRALALLVLAAALIGGLLAWAG